MPVDCWAFEFLNLTVATATYKSCPRLYSTKTSGIKSQNFAKVRRKLGSFQNFSQRLLERHWEGGAMLDNGVASHRFGLQKFQRTRSGS